MLRGHEWNRKNCVFKMYNIETGLLVTEWEAKCSHYLTNGSLVAIQVPGISNTEFLVEGCPHKGCEKIQVYSLNDGSPNPYPVTKYEDVRPHKMCSGPGDALLVCDAKSRHLLQLSTFGSIHTKFELVRKWPLGLQSVYGIRYLKNLDILVLSSTLSKTIRGFNLPNHTVLWEHNGSIGDIPLNPEEVCSTSDGWICVANGNNLLALDLLMVPC